MYRSQVRGAQIPAGTILRTQCFKHSHNSTVPHRFDYERSYTWLNCAKTELTVNTDEITIAHTHMFGLMPE